VPLKDEGVLGDDEPEEVREQPGREVPPVKS
jgi:hypothetical protein